MSRARLLCRAARSWAQPQQQRRYCAAAPAEQRRPPPDHRDLGTQQKLFTTSVYSPGSPIFLPHGARVFNRLVAFLRDQYVRYGFDEVITPTIYKKALWAKSGHLDNYAEDMFTVTSMSPARREEATTPADDQDTPPSTSNPPAEHDEYGLKPMNCPGHCLIFASEPRSYRDLPIRYADFSPLHRNEISGALAGLTRVRRFHQDDGHIFCRPSQIEAEIASTLALVRSVYATLRLGPYRLALSTRPADGHYMGSLADWDAAESALRAALDASGQPWSTKPGDGAFYGPKIDVVLRDSDGKEHQTATIQLDFQLPRRFALEYLAPAPDAEQRGEEATVTDPAQLAVYGPVRPVMIHRAVFGSVERLLALLIEHYAGRWPLWLNPRQAIVLSVNDSDAVVAWAKHTQDVLRGTAPLSVESSPTHLAVDTDFSARSLPLKVREAKTKGYGVVVVVGPRNVAAGTVAVDAGGIPPVPAAQQQADKDEVMQQEQQQGGKGDKTKAVDMTPAELLAFMKGVVAAFH